MTVVLAARSIVRGTTAGITAALGPATTTVPIVIL